MGVTDFVDGDAEQSLNLEFARLLVCDADPQDRHVTSLAEAAELHVVFTSDRDERTRLGLREQRGGCVNVIARHNLRDPHAGPDAET